MNNLDAYRAIWTSVHEVYEKTHMVSEYGLQAVLYGEFLREFREFRKYPDVHIAVEPYCNGQHPDLAVVRDSVITDLFELKYAPGGYADYDDDIDRLSSYVAGDRTCYVAIDPATGYNGECHARPLSVPGLGVDRECRDRVFRSLRGKPRQVQVRLPSGIATANAGSNGAPEPDFRQVSRRKKP
ncbi:MAG: hypothetical protein F4206_00035 [Gammaproteobacteria bacterium]|nr:hypothetical protein [Gammaproteobacteria bacterium]MYG65106.1 hypothetical protein [Gammaproteobacteria bacterium]